MNESLNPQRRAGPDEEIVYSSIPSVYQPPPFGSGQVQPVYQQPVPLIAAQPVYQQSVPVPPPPVSNQRSYSQTGDTSLETSRQSYYDQTGNLVENQKQVFDDPYARRLNLLDWLRRVIYFGAGLLVVLLALRFLFRLLSNASGSGFTSFIYNFTAPFVGPFNGIFNDQAFSKTNVAEFSTLLAIAIYSLVAYGIVRLLYVLFAPNRSSKSVFTSSRQRRY